MTVKFCLIVNLFAIIATSLSKLNVPRVLLPLFKEIKVTFTLESTDGDCYRWWVAEEEVISIEPVDFDKQSQCWKKVILETSPNCVTRNVAVVLAENVNSKQVVRCDIIVDTISSLAISTTTKELLLEDAPELFEVKAYDNQGNCFTTLEGVQFDWTITCLGPNKEEMLLRFIKFKDSPYKAAPSITKMEEKNSRGRVVLIEGIKTGSAKASAKLPYKEYSHIKSADVALTVTANLNVVPSQVHIMVGDEISFKILKLKRGNKELISLPHTQYHLKVESEDLATATGGGTVLALRKGTTKVVLYDRNVNLDDPNVKLPSATLYVVEPYKVLITTFPYRSWAVLINENVDIAMEVYSRDNCLIHLGPNVQAILKVNEIFHANEISANGTWLTGWAVKEGVSRIHAQFKGTERAKVKIASTADLEVYPRIVLTPSEVVFPWDPEVQPTFEMQLKVSGGDGLFIWSSSNHTIGMVTQTGLVRVHNYGYFEVSASMQRNHNNREYTKFHTVLPSRLEIIEFIMETEIDAPLYLHVALYADIPSSNEDGSYSQVPISHCQNVNFDVEVSNGNFIYNRSDVIKPVGISCANVALIGLKSGSSKIVVSCTKGGRKLEDSVTVTAFNPLSLHYPKSEIVLALGCSTQMIFSGGPPILKTDSSDHKLEVSVTNIDMIRAVDKTNAFDKFIVEVTCRKLGEANVTLTIGNIPTLPNCRHRAYSKTVTVICGQPGKIQLRPALRAEDSNRCPLNVDAGRIIAYSGKDIQVDVNVFDSLGRNFLDASSLLFQWDIRPKDMAKIHNPNGIYKKDQIKTGLNYLYNNYQLITPLKKYGEMHLIAHAVGYKKEILTKSKATCISCDGNNKKVMTELLKKATAQLLLVDHAVVSPSEIIIYNNPANKKVISVTGGSGYFEFKLSGKDVALIKYNDVTREIEVTPKNDGNAGIMVTDLCLASQLPVVNVTVVSIAIIRVDMSEKVQVGRCIPCTVRFYDETDNLLALDDISMINIAINSSKDIVKVKRLINNQENVRNSGEAHFIVSGLELGSVNLAFSVKSGAKDIKSAPIELVVFPPLRMSPRNATLLIGSKFQFTFKGGPYPDSTIEYNIDKPHIAGVDEFGIVNGLKHGIVSLGARAIGINPSTGQKVVYSEDKVMAEIISLTGIKIAAPLTRFVSGSTVPVWITGVPEKISASILANVEPPICFKWTIDDSDIVKIVGIFDPLGIVYGQEDNIAVRLRGLKAGKTTLRLSAIVNGAVLNKSKQQKIKMKTHLHIDVFEKLYLNTPSNVHGKEILMAPFSSILLRTNMDDLLNVKYSISNAIDPLAESTEKSYGASKAIINVSSSGVIESFGNVGKAMVVVEATDSEDLTQQMTLAIEVKSIHYMMVKADAKWKVKHGKLLNSIPLGSEFILQTLYYDSTGSEFTSGSLQLQVRNSRLDFAKISPTCCNDSMLISTRRQGSSVVKVWGEGYRRTADYIKLNVKQAITPALDTLTIGDIVCLHTPLELDESETVARWTVTNKCLQLLNNRKGIIRVATAAATEVYLTHDLHQGSPIKINIEPPSIIRTFEDRKKYVTNTHLRMPYVIPLVFGILNQSERTKNTFSGWDCRKDLVPLLISYPHKCYLKFTNENISENVYNVLKTHSSFDSDTGQYSCTITPSILKSEEISIFATNLIVWVEIPEARLKSNPIELRFLPGIFLNDELLITEKYFALLTITGLTEVLEYVKVEANDPSVLFVPSTYYPNGNKLILKIELVDYHWKLEELEEPMIIKVVSPLTSQQIKVIVKVDRSIMPTCGTTAPGPLTNFFGSSVGFVCISTIIIFLISFYVYSTHMQPVVNVNLSTRSLLTEKRPSMVLKESALLGESASFKRSTTFPLDIPARYSSKISCSPGCTTVSRQNNMLHADVYGEPTNSFSPSPGRTKRFI